MIGITAVNKRAWPLTCKAQLPAIPAFVTLVRDCFDIAVCYELLYIKGNMCLYKDGSVAVYKCIRVNVQSTILLHDFSGRHSSSSDCASIIRSDI